MASDSIGFAIRKNWQLLAVAQPPSIDSIGFAIWANDKIPYHGESAYISCRDDFHSKEYSLKIPTEHCLTWLS